MHPDPVRRETVVGYREEAEILGVFDPQFAPSTATVTHAKDLQLAGTGGDEHCDTRAVNVGDAQLAAHCEVLHPDNHPDPGWEEVQVDAILPGLSGGKQSGDVGSLRSASVGDHAVGTGA